MFIAVFGWYVSVQNIFLYGLHILIHVSFFLSLDFILLTNIHLTHDGFALEHKLDDGDALVFESVESTRLKVIYVVISHSTLF